MKQFADVTELVKVCEENLDNSSLYMHIDDTSHDVTLIFIETNGQREAHIVCQKILQYTMMRSPLDNEVPFFVGEVHGSQRLLREVLEEHYPMKFNTSENYPMIWCLKIVGEFDLCIQCLEIGYEFHERIS